MIPREAIIRSIEGGWRPLPPEKIQNWRLKNGRSYVFNWKSGWHSVFKWQEIVCDRTFWQAIGVSKGIPVTAMIAYDDGDAGLWWRHCALRFYDIILTGGSTDEFWAELLTPSTNS